MKDLIVQFAQDLVDRRAKRRLSRIGWSDAWAILLSVLSSATLLVEGWRKVGIEFLGMPGTVASVLLCIVGITWAVYVIRATQWDNATRVYRFLSVVRQSAKAALIVLLVMVPRLASKSAIDLWPLPTTIYGELRSHSNTPIPNIVVRVVDHGEDVTDSPSLPSDSDGFYVVVTKRRVRRDATLIAGCSQGPVELTMATSDQIAATRERLDPSAILFRHFIQCEGPK